MLLKVSPGGPFRVTGKIDNEGDLQPRRLRGLGRDARGKLQGRYIGNAQGRSESNLFGREMILQKKASSAVSSNQYADPRTSGLTAQVSKDTPKRACV